MFDTFYHHSYSDSRFSDSNAIIFIRVNFQSSVPFNPIFIRTHKFIRAHKPTVFLTGTRDVSYLFLKKSPLSWDPVLYGYFQAYQNTVFALLLIVGTPVLKKIFGLADSLLVLMGLVSTIASLLLFGFSHKTWMVFLGERSLTPNAVI